MVTLPGTTHLAQTPAQLADSAAQWITHLSAESIRQRGRFVFGLSGGSTPQLLYQRLALEPYASQIDWYNWWCFFGDERACPPTDAQSNYHAAKIHLFDKVAIDRNNIFRMRAESDDLNAAAAAYAGHLEAVLGIPPEIDCLLLGVGTDGHTASLFPRSAALKVNDRWCTRGRAPKPPLDRITLTFRTINAARHVGFLVSGREKQKALQRVAAGTVPAARVRPQSGELHWFLDPAAAGA